MVGALRAEWVRFRSSPWCIFGFAAAIAIASVVTVTLGTTSQVRGTLASSELVNNCLHGLQIGQVGIVLAMASLCGQEYEESSLRTTLLCVPNRGRFLGTKLISGVIVSVVGGIASGLISVSIGIAVFRVNIDISELANLGKLVCLTWISWVLMGLISGGLAIVTKTLVVPLAVLIPLMLGLSQMLMVVTSAAKYLPDLATINLFVSQQSSQFLQTWQGIGVQALWALALAVPAAVLTLRRDVR